MAYTYFVAALIFLVGMHRSEGNVVQISCLAKFSALTSPRTIVQCPPKCSLIDNNLCGTGTYAMGRICAAAVHDAKLIPTTGGIVTVTRSTPINGYTGSDHYGVFSTSCFASTYSYTFTANSASTSYYRRPADGSCGNSLTNNVDNCANTGRFCKNGGTCVNGVNSFTCACAPGFSGPNCIYNMLDCVRSPCQNSGNCTKVAGNRYCVCVGQYGGVFCDTPVSQCYSGVFNSSIVANSQMTASSDNGVSWEAFRARLGNVQCWISGAVKIGSWIQVDFLKPLRISGVITRGRPGIGQWVTKYKISYGNVKNNLVFIKDASGADKVFNGNTDSRSDVVNHFGTRYYARYWRLTVVNYSSQVALQLEYITC